MKKTIAIFICALLGVAFGYIAAPIASMSFIQSTEPDMFGAFMLATVDSSIACNCENQSASESVKTVTDDLAILQRWRDQNPNSVQLKQEIGLAEVHLARLDAELAHQNQADENIKRAQAELAALGWKNVSAAHLLNPA
ncbi:MAG: hypothetical protein WA758_16090 [Candidatus Acidiferrales bacterium]